MTFRQPLITHLLNSALSCFLYFTYSPDVPGDLLKTEFSKYGKVTAFKFFEKDHKMALIQMETIDDAVMGLIVSS